MRMEVKAIIRVKMAKATRLERQGIFGFTVPSMVSVVRHGPGAH